MKYDAKISIAFTAALLLKTFPVLFLILLASSQQLLGQFIDDFSDGDFTENPSWQGDVEKFTVDAQRLRLTAPPVNSDAILITPSSSFYNATWEFDLRLEFNPSSNNYVMIYLASDQADLRSPLNGYYVMIGGTTDEVSLYRQTGAVTTRIIDGEDGRVNASIVDVGIKVTRDVLGNWQLFSDSAAMGYRLEGEVHDATHPTTQFFGVRCVYTSTRSDDFYFDNFIVNGEAFIDLQPPDVVLVKAVSSSELEVVFSEVVTPMSAREVTNYLIPEIGPPTVAILSNDSTTVSLAFEDTFTNGVPQLLKVKGVTDLVGNALEHVEIPFLYFHTRSPERGDVVITEIFADPTPVVGMPEAEFVELYNRADVPFDVQDWKFADAGDTVRFKESFILLPDRYVVICHPSATAAFSKGDVIGLAGFPSLNNAGDHLKLLDSAGHPLDEVKYSNLWYGDEEKKDGGWSLERIDPGDFCRNERNWTASRSVSGATPALQNSVHDPTPDVDPPRLVSVQVIDTDSVVFLFDEKLYEALPPTTALEVAPSIEIDVLGFASSAADAIAVRFAEPLDSTLAYKFTWSGIKDCPGNPLDSAFSQVMIKLDQTPPTVKALNVISADTIELIFDEPVLAETAQQESHYVVNGSTVPLHVDLIEDRSVRLRFAEPFVNGKENIMSIAGIRDRAMNEMTGIEVAFMFFDPMPSQYRDVIISEILPDPAPVVGMPEAEFIEIYNRSTGPFDLQGWSVTDGRDAAVLESRILLPGEYLILCLPNARSRFDSLGPTMGVARFPSLNNRGDRVVLLNERNEVIDSLTYSDSWYRDAQKRDGGWSLERINPHDVCRGALNWIASNDVRGGTPGHRNSVHDETPDMDGPVLLSFETLSDTAIKFTFSEPLAIDRLLAGAFGILPQLPIDTVTFASSEWTTITVSFLEPLDSSITYTITVDSLFDCPGNLLEGAPVTMSVLLDQVPPEVVNVDVPNRSTILIVFDEPVHADAIDETKYEVLSVGHPMSVMLEDQTKVSIVFDTPFNNGRPGILLIRGITDLAGNEMPSTELPFMFFEKIAATQGDVRITEILCDPAPVRSLPEVEFVEVFNRSQHPFDLHGWSLSDETATGMLNHFILLPGEYAILCATRSAEALELFGATVGVSTFPSLNNSSDVIVLKDERGFVIDSVRYDKTWYRDSEKSDGGWSLEIIDPENLCEESTNWQASIDERGGTPGAANSVFANNPDLTGPRLLSAFPESATSLLVRFDEKLEEHLPSASAFQIEPENFVSGVAFVDNTLHSLRLTLAMPFSGGVPYTLTASGVYDCAGNIIDENHNDASFALPEIAERNDLVINEVLFNPTSTGVDFVELYNRSAKYINLNGWTLANVRGDSLYDLGVVTRENVLLPPASYLVLVEDANILKGEYVNGKEAAFFESDLPSMPDDEGIVVVVDNAGDVIDSLSYTEDWHSPFLRNPEGVSLERIHFDAPTNDPSNWRSASSAFERATPGYINSNVVDNIRIDESIIVEPEVFVPNTGQPGFTLIRYDFEHGGFVANILILDPYGREVKRIANNVLVGTEGFFRWDGDDGNGMPARIGPYMVYVEVFDETGMTKRFSKRVVVAGHFR